MNERWIRGAILFALLWVVCALPSGAQARNGGREIERIELRVLASVGEGLVEVDRGKRDGVQAGDQVRILTRAGGIRRGKD